jgi:hypothetical protein
MLSIVLSPDPNMQAKRKSIQQELDWKINTTYWKWRSLSLKVPRMWESAMQGSVFNWKGNRHYMHGYQRRKAVHLYLYYAGNWNKQTQTEFYEKETLNLHHNFVDVVQSKRKYIADGNDNIANQATKISAVLLAQSTDPIIAKLKFPVCNSICDVKTVDSASVLMNDDAMNDEDTMFDDEVDELPASSVQELPLIKDWAGQLATIARGSLFPDKVAATNCILQVAKAAVTLPTPDNQPRSHLLWSKVETTMPECVVPRNEGEHNLTVQVHQKLLKDYFNSHWWSCGPQYNGPSSLPVFKPKDETSRVQNFCQTQI